MMKQFFITSAAIGVLVACGQVGTADTQAAEAQTVETEPQVGDRIPEPDLENSNRLAAAGAAASELMSQGVREIGWEELMPEGEEERLAQLYQQQMSMLYSGGPIAEGSAGDQMIQIGTFNTVKELNETKVRIPGYTVPFEFGANAEITEFLLVPYYGACLHAPPPPPNQLIYVSYPQGLKLDALYDPFWITGVLKTSLVENDTATSAYAMVVNSISPYVPD